MKLLQINTTVNTGSTGRIAEDIGMVMMQSGHQSYISFGRKEMPSKSVVYRIGNNFDVIWHVISTRIFDRHGLSSTHATKNLIHWIKKINPDIIHLHCLHGYYIDFRVLFQFLGETQIPVVWTFHDAWAFTGHCTYFDSKSCFKWQSQCNNCPSKKAYPSSYLIDNSLNNFNLKKRLFNLPERMSIVCPSSWLADHTKRSFLNKYPIEVIYNGIDLSKFKPNASPDIRTKFNIEPNKSYVLGVASIWTKRKGLMDFIRLRERLSTDIEIVLVGISEKQAKNLPIGISAINRTENINELAALYSEALAFINPTWVDNFPTTNIEALACGTPVITYKTGGSPEAIDENTGMVVEKGDIEGIVASIQKIISKGKEHYLPLCRARAEKLFNKEDRYKDYLKIYESLISERLAE